jgi:hypothetical protein
LVLLKESSGELAWEKATELRVDDYDLFVFYLENLSVGGHKDHRTVGSLTLILLMWRIG